MANVIKPLVISHISICTSKELINEKDPTCPEIQGFVRRSDPPINWWLQMWSLWQNPRCKGKSQQTHQNWCKFHLFENVYNVQNYSKCHNTSYVSCIVFVSFFFQSLQFTNSIYIYIDQRFRFSVIHLLLRGHSREKQMKLRSKSQLGVRLWKAINSVHSELWDHNLF